MQFWYKLDCPKWKPKNQQQQQQSSHSNGNHRIQMEFMQIVSRSIWINLSGFYVKFAWDFVVFAINYVILIEILTLATEQFIHTSHIVNYKWFLSFFSLFLSIFGFFFFHAFSSSLLFIYCMTESRAMFIEKKRTKKTNGPISMQKMHSKDISN